MNSFIQIPPRLHCGQGSLEMVKDIALRTGAKKALIFTDTVLRKLNMITPLETYLEQAGVTCSVIDEIIPEPTVQSVEKTMSCVSDTKVDLLIGIGGGSVMDTAKLAGVLLGASYTVRDLLQNPELARKRIKTLMIPTTCGTGSEATGNAIVAIPEEQTKKGIVNPEM
ncbi:MAG: iron-containing alcohol dehydrogenase, partial [Spirochaetaceae bacterium]|nr:iron-containing alcohol dehydrogenase [Spirochaetaceae bacterium]